MIGCTDMQTQQTSSEHLASSNNIVLLVAYRFVNFYRLPDQCINIFFDVLSRICLIPLIGNQILHYISTLTFFIYPIVELLNSRIVQFFNCSIVERYNY